MSNGDEQKLLGGATLKKFYEHNWEYIQANESNPSQTWNRIKKHANDALQHLALLSGKLPDEKLQEIFSDGNMDGIILRLLKFHPLWVGFPIGRTKELDAWRTHLSTSLLEKCLYFCINQYQLLEEETPALAETNIQLLKQTIKICKDIEKRVELLELKSKGTKVESDYLFNWNKIPGPDKIKLGRFMGNEIGIGDTPYEMSDVKKSKNEKELSCSLLFENEEGPGITVTITLENGDRGVAIFNLSDMETKGYKKCNLKVVEERGQKFIYKEK